MRGKNFGSVIHTFFTKSRYTLLRDYCKPIPLLRSELSPLCCQCCQSIVTTANTEDNQSLRSPGAAVLLIYAIENEITTEKCLSLPTCVDGAAKGYWCIAITCPEAHIISLIKFSKKIDHWFDRASVNLIVINDVIYIERYLLLNCRNDSMSITGRDLYVFHQPACSESKWPRNIHPLGVK